jgi:hypothetical protein
LRLGALYFLWAVAADLAHLIVSGRHDQEGDRDRDLDWLLHAPGIGSIPNPLYDPSGADVGPGGGRTPSASSNPVRFRYGVGVPQRARASMVAVPIGWSLWAPTSHASGGTARLAYTMPWSTEPPPDRTI